MREIDVERDEVMGLCERLVDDGARGPRQLGLAQTFVLKSVNFSFKLSPKMLQLLMKFFFANKFSAIY